MFPLQFRNEVNFLLLSNFGVIFLCRLKNTNRCYYVISVLKSVQTNTSSSVKLFKSEVSIWPRLTILVKVLLTISPNMAVLGLASTVLSHSESQLKHLFISWVKRKTDVTICVLRRKIQQFSFKPTINVPSFFLHQFFYIFFLLFIWMSLWACYDTSLTSC